VQGKCSADLKGHPPGPQYLPFLLGVPGLQLEAGAHFTYLECPFQKYGDSGVFRVCSAAPADDVWWGAGQMSAFFVLQGLSFEKESTWQGGT